MVAPSWDQVRSWRVATRKSLIAARMAMPDMERRAQGQATIARLSAHFDLARHRTLGIYWPIRGEIDVRATAAALIASGCVIGLPVVVEEAAPLEFWRWHPGMPLRHDRAKIPIPAQRELIAPAALLVPLVGFDRNAYRLGYGGGYYDRTLAAFAEKPLCIGLGYDAAELPSIHPQPHDIPLDAIVTPGLALTPGPSGA